ncbi:MAG: MMPL family transporter [Acidimicrobiia bacterium]
MSRFLDRLGRNAARHHWWFIGAWFVAAVVAVFVAAGLDGQTNDSFQIPGAQSQQALDLLETRFPTQAGATATVVFDAQPGLDNPQVQPPIQSSITALGKLPHVASVGALITAKKEPYAGKIGLVTVQYDTQVQDVGLDAYKQLQQATEPAAKAGVRLAYGGAVVDYSNRPPQGNADLVGIMAAVVILLFAFGSVVAMGLPILTALFGLGVGIALIHVIAAVTTIGTLAPILATMIGLGVGIDYSLFIITRYRENVADGMTIEAAAGHSVATAGQAVLFAGCTVVIAICGLAISGIPYVAKLGYMSALVVVVMMIAAMTLLPAMIGLVGKSIDRWRVPSPFHHHDRSGHSQTESIWARWATTVARHAWGFAIVGIAILLLLAWPVLSMRLGESDDGNLPTSTTQRQAYDLIADGFGAGTNGPLLVVVQLPTANDTELLTSISQAISKNSNVADVLPPDLSPNTTGPRVAVLTVFPKTSPESPQTSALVEELRSSVLPAVIATGGAQAYVGGLTAAYIDIGNRISDRLPYFIGAVVLFSFLLLMLVFHSVLVPLTAAVMNLLSVAAAYGVTVAVFQWGWAKDVIGLESTVPIVPFIPMMMFAVLFGLSMDYQVFLLTRIREEYDLSGNTRQAVVLGLARTARVITSAALIMIFVFGAFIANLTPEVKMFGLGLAFAVLVDATIVRMMLVPSIMEILGDANWWFPKWLSWLPRLDIDSAAKPAPNPQPQPHPEPASVGRG